MIRRLPFSPGPPERIARPSTITRRHNATSCYRTTAIPPVQTVPTREHVGPDMGTGYHATAVAGAAGNDDARDLPDNRRPRKTARCTETGEVKAETVDQRGSSARLRTACRVAEVPIEDAPEYRDRMTTPKRYPRVLTKTVRGEPRVRHSSSSSLSLISTVVPSHALARWLQPRRARSVLDAGGRVLHARAAAVLTVVGFVLSTV